MRAVRSLRPGERQLGGRQTSEIPVQSRPGNVQRNPRQPNPRQPQPHAFDEDEALAAAFSQSERDELQDQDLALAVELSMIAASKPTKTESHAVPTRTASATGALPGTTSTRAFPRAPMNPSASAPHHRIHSRPTSGRIAAPITESGAAGVVVSRTSIRPTMEVCKFCRKEFGGRIIATHEAQCSIRCEPRNTDAPISQSSTRQPISANPTFRQGLGGRAMESAPRLSARRQGADSLREEIASAPQVSSFPGRVQPVLVSGVGAPSSRLTDRMPIATRFAVPVSTVTTRRHAAATSDAAAYSRNVREQEGAMAAALALSEKEAQTAHDQALRAAQLASRRETEAVARRLREAEVSALEATRREAAAAAQRQERENLLAAVERSRLESERAAERRNRETLLAAVEQSRIESERAAELRHREALAAAVLHSRRDAEREAERRLEEETVRLLEESRREAEAREGRERELALARSREEAEADRLLRQAQEEEYLASLAADEEKDRLAEQATRAERERLEAARLEGMRAEAEAEAARSRLEATMAQARGLPVEPEPEGTGGDVCDVILQLPWGPRLRRRFRPAAPPVALARFLLAHAAAHAAAGDGAEWARVLGAAVALKSVDGVVAAAAPAAGGGWELGQPRGDSLAASGVGRMEKLTVELDAPHLP